MKKFLCACLIILFLFGCTTKKNEPVNISLKDKIIIGDLTDKKLYVSEELNSFKTLEAGQNPSSFATKNKELFVLNAGGLPGEPSFLSLNIYPKNIEVSLRESIDGLVYFRGLKYVYGLYEGKIINRFDDNGAIDHIAGDQYKWLGFAKHNNKPVLIVENKEDVIFIDEKMVAVQKIPNIADVSYALQIVDSVIVFVKKNEIYLFNLNDKSLTKRDFPTEQSNMIVYREQLVSARKSFLYYLDKKGRIKKTKTSHKSEYLMRSGENILSLEYEPGNMFEKISDVFLISSSGKELRKITINSLVNDYTVAKDKFLVLTDKNKISSYNLINGNEQNFKVKGSPYSIFYFQPNDFKIQRDLAWPIYKR